MRLSVPCCGSMLAAFSLTTLLSLTSLTTYAGSNNQYPPPGAFTLADHQAQLDARKLARQRATEQTQSLVALQDKWANAKGSEKSRALQLLLAKAQERQALLIELVRSTPAEALRVAIPEEQQLQMPAEVLGFLGQKVELEGELEAIIEDHEDGTHKLRHALKTTFGERFELHFAGKPPRNAHGTPMRVQGLVFETGDPQNGSTAVMALESADSSVEVLNCCESTTSSTSASTAPLDNTFGEQRTLVMLVNFQDDPSAQPYSLQQANDLMFGAVSDFYRENSFGQTWLTGDVKGWYTLPMNQPVDSSTCNASTVAQLAQQAAVNDGVNLANYNRYVYVFPQTSCFPTGQGTVGGVPSESWINGNWFELKVVGHELGHNFGLYHAGSLDCGDTTLGTDCRISPYGDTFDIMANKAAGHFSAFNKQQLGWLDSGLGDIVTAGVDGVYELGAYEPEAGSSPKALKILKEIDPATGYKSWYYLEYRQAYGFDSFLAGNGNVLNGVIVREVEEASSPTSLLLDMTPNSASFGDWNDPALEAGQSFSDPDSGLTISTQWADGASARVDVSFGSQTCVHANPGLAITPGESQWVEPGTTVEYEISVTNNDSAGCAPAQFDLSSSAPAGWNATLASNAVSLSPGTTATTTLVVTSSSNAGDGFYDIPMQVGNSTDSRFAAQDSATYVISQANSGNQAPVAADDSAATLQDTPLSIDVLANDQDPDGDSLTIVQVIASGTGRVTLNADGTLTYTPKRKYKGNDSFSYTVSDGNLTATANVTVTVSQDSGSGGGSTDGGSTGGGGNGKGKNR